MPGAAEVLVYSPSLNHPISVIGEGHFSAKADGRIQESVVTRIIDIVDRTVFKQMEHCV